MITLPRADNERLMLPASFNRDPAALVSFWRSEPAKSMRWSFEILFIVASPVWSLQVREKLALV
jgi:hypothetical protein